MFFGGCRTAQIVPAWQPGCEKMEREWDIEKEMGWEWDIEKEMGWEWRNREIFTLYTSSFSLYFLPLYPFPITNIISFCRKMLNTNNKFEHSCQWNIFKLRENMELLFEVCKCTLKKRTFICVTSFEKYAIGSYLLIFVIDSICMTFVEVMSAP